MGRMGVSNQAHAVAYRHGWPTVSKLKDTINGYYRLLCWLYDNELAGRKLPFYKPMMEYELEAGREMLAAITKAYNGLARVRRKCHESNQLTLNLEG